MLPEAALTVRVAPLRTMGVLSVWRLSSLLTMLPVRSNELPPMVKAGEPELNVMPAKSVSAARSLFGVVLAPTPNARPLPFVGAVSLGSQLAPVLKLSSPPSESHATAAAPKTSISP
jgi:hypothetical protein